MLEMLLLIRGYLENVDDDSGGGCYSCGMGRSIETKITKDQTSTVIKMDTRKREKI
jgi:hypothetical protein